MNRELTANEKAFIEKICTYDSPAKGYEGFFVTDLRSIDRDDPERREKISAYHYYENKTKEIIDSLDLMVNTFSPNNRSVIDEIKKDKVGYANLVELAYEWVDAVGKMPETMADERNIRAWRMCNALSFRMDEEYGRVGKPDGDKYFANLGNCISRMHKTLMQSATTLLANVLKETDKVANKYLSEEYGDKDVRLPMI